jgi:hypothetical protein
VRRSGHAVASLSLKGEAAGRRIDLSAIRGTGYGAALDGDGVLLLDEPYQSRVRLRWEQLSLDEIADQVPALDGLHGASDGELIIAPTQDARSPEPLGLFASGYLSGDYRGTPFGEFRASGFIGPRRILVDSARFNFGGGTADVWVRFNQHPRPSLYGRVDLDRFDLNYLAHMIREDAQPTPGLVSGNAVVVGNPTELHRLFGRSHLRLEQSDLTSLPVISMLYNLLNLDVGEKLPLGEGDAHLRLEGRRLTLVHFDYFNRGAEITGSGQAEDISLGDQSPVTGLAVATLRPLRDTRLPFADAIDAIFSAAQGKAASVRIGGTLAQPAPTAAPLSEVVGGLEALLRGRTY